jgi:hypothetical protein
MPYFQIAGALPPGYTPLLSKEVTFTEADLDAAALSQTFDFDLALPDDAIFENMVAILNAPMVGPQITDGGASVGLVASPGIYGDTANAPAPMDNLVTAEADDRAAFDANDENALQLGGAGSVRFIISAVGANVDAVTGFSLTIKIFYYQADAVPIGAGEPTPVPLPPPPPS